MENEKHKAMAEKEYECPRCIEAELRHQKQNNMENVIIVWKDGTYKEVEKHSAWEFDNDDNWLVTISAGLSKNEGLVKAIDEIKKKYQHYVSNVEWHIKTNKPAILETRKFNAQIEYYNEMIADLNRLEALTQYKEGK